MRGGIVRSLASRVVERRESGWPDCGEHRERCLGHHVPEVSARSGEEACGKAAADYAATAGEIDVRAEKEAERWEKLYGGHG